MRRKAANPLGRWISTAAVLALSFAVFAPPAYAEGENVDASAGSVVDGDTRYTYQDVLGEATSTQYAGRVWTDKTVTSERNLRFHDPDNVDAATVDVDKGSSDFLVTYSALAASQTVTGGAVPSDTVFILDLSASMTWGDRPEEQNEVDREESRLQSMITSLNMTIDRLVRANGQNRIAIVTFNGKSETLLGLTDGDTVLDRVKNSQYLTISDWNPGKDSNTDDTTATVTCNINNDIADKTVSTAGGTNIQAGLFRGMSILADNSNTTALVGGEQVTRVPNVVLMSDGAPTTFSSAQGAQYIPYKNRSDTNECRNDYVTDSNHNGYIVGKQNSDDEGTPVCRADTDKHPVLSGSWWETNSGVEIGAGDNNNPDSADGFMALLTASYFKNKITQKYYGASPADGKQANVYTVGFATDVQNNEMAMMANIVLDPAKYLKQAENFNGSESDDNNAEIRQVYTAANQYLGGQNTLLQGSIGDGASDDQIVFKIPTNSHPDDGNDPSSLEYPTKAFKAADDQQLADALAQIADLIAESAKSPTQTGSDPTESGYITYTDPIGEYMHVDSVKTLIWAGMQFGVEKKEGATNQQGTQCTTYTFKKTSTSESEDDYTIDSPVYGQHNVNEIKVELCPASSGDSQILTVRIPASAIPIRVTNVVLDANGDPSKIDSNNALPLRLVYGVSLNAGVKNGDGTLNKGAVGNYLDAESAAPHKSSDGGTAYFYSNLYTKKGMNANGGTAETAGDATVEFQPADDNPYYFFQENTPLYADEQCQNRATSLESDGIYYLKTSYYKSMGSNDGDAAATLVPDVLKRSGATLQDFVDSDSSGRLYVKAGAPRIGNLADAIADKGNVSPNNTGTASTVRYPTFTGDINSGSFVVYLGNNGRIGLPIPVTPASANINVSKTVEGIDSTDLDFTFDLTFNDTETDTETDGDSDRVTDAEQVQVCTTGDDGTSSCTGLHESGHTASITLDGSYNDDNQHQRQGAFFLRFLKAGTYQFTLVENRDNIPAGWTYDDTAYTVVVSVKKVPVNELTVSSITYNGSSVDSASFVNKFASVSSLPLTGGDVTARVFGVAGGVVLLLAGLAWLLARRRRV